MNKNIIKTAFLALGGIFALLLIIVGVVAFFITGPAPTDEWGMSWITPTDEAAASMDDKMTAIEEQMEGAASGDELYLELTDEEVTSKLYRMDMDGNLSVDIAYPQVYFTDGMLLAYAEVDIGINVQSCVQAKVGVDEKGQLDMTIEGLDLGRIPIPKTLINNVMTALEHALEEHWEELDVILKEIVIEPGVAKITLIKK